MTTLASTKKTWYEFTLLQMASESYLDGIDHTVPADVQRQLKLGNNNPILDPDLRGATRLTDSQAKHFTDTYEIIHHLPNQNSGFSGTLFKKRGTNEYTLSFRSTEYQNADKGGDFERDGASGADGEIAFKGGFPYAQMDSMEQYYAFLKSGTNPLLPAGATLNVTGYSLGGNLATILNILHPADITHTYLFNSAGIGASYKGGAAEVLSFYKKILQNPSEGTRYLNITGDENKPLDDLYQAARSTTGGFPNNIYTDPRYKWAIKVTSSYFDFYRPLSVPNDNLIPVNKVTNLYGRADMGDFEIVANSGFHPPATKVFIEDQPDFAGTGGFIGGVGDFGTTHSITLIIDSLATQNLLLSIDPNLSQENINKILSSASNLRGQGGVALTDNGRGEADSLEQIINALGKIFNLSGPDLEPDPSTGGYGNIVKRNEFYNRIDEINVAVKAQPIPTARIDLLSNGTTAYNLSLQNTDEGRAYRYALIEGIPFALVGADYSAQNITGELDIYNPVTKKGALTEEYLADRSRFLERKLYFAQKNINNDYTQPINTAKNPHAEEPIASPNSSAENLYLRIPVYFEDRSTDPAYTILQGVSDPNSLRKIIFGNDADEKDATALNGSIYNDHLYGGGGNDHLHGGDGEDYLEGNIGGDTLNGGKDNDILLGGEGTDTYIYNAGDGFDLIDDTDGLGQIRYNGQALTGGKRSTSFANTWQSEDKKITYTFISGNITTGGTLLISSDQDKIEIKNFKNNQLGLNLEAGTIATAPTTSSTIVGDALVETKDIHNNIISYQTGANNADRYLGTAADERILGNLGNDSLSGGAGNDVIEGGAGNDILNGGRGTNYFMGGDGDDEIILGEGQDIAFGGNGNDLIFFDGHGYRMGSFFVGGFYWNKLDVDPVTNYVYASTDFNYFEPGLEGNVGLQFSFVPAGSQTSSLGGFPVEEDYADLTQTKTVFGGYGNDVIEGAEGKDYLFGEGHHDLLLGNGGDDLIDAGEGNDSVFGGAGKDFITLGDVDDFSYGEAGDDILIGGLGKDILFGDTPNPYLIGSKHGEDFLEGGAGNDQLSGGGGKDILLGGDGDDTLVGDNSSTILDAAYHGNDYLEGGAGNDQLHGDEGDDILEGDDGHDLLLAGSGDDTAEGGEGDDEIGGGEGEDYLYGDEGVDKIFGDADNDTIYGGAGDDTNQTTGLYADRTGSGKGGLDGGDGNDIIYGNAGNDLLLGQAGEDELYGNEDNDLLYGHGDNDTLDGGAGSDQLSGGAGNDKLTGGIGNDALFDVDGGDEDYYFTAGDGQDTLEDNSGNNTVHFTGVDPNAIQTFKAGSSDLVIYYSADDRIQIKNGLFGAIQSLALMAKKSARRSSLAEP